MRVPDRLVSLVEDGIIEEVIRPLMSGKEAQLFLVIAGGEERVAKIYKDSTQRLFKHRTEYTEGRRTRNSRDQRAMGKRSKHGRERDEQSWHSAEVDMIYRLRDAGVRVPTPFSFMDGVLVMELITDAEGNPAPQIGTMQFGQQEALAVHDLLLREVVRMLCAGVIHGDLSEFNVLMSADGPVVIDFPQAVDAANNPGARKLLMRDVDNLHRFVGRFVTGMLRLPYAEEMWELYERRQLTPDTQLVGKWAAPAGVADVDAVLREIDSAEREEWERREQSSGDPRDLRSGVDVRRGPVQRDRGAKQPLGPDQATTGDRSTAPKTQPIRDGKAPTRKDHAASPRSESDRPRHGRPQQDPRAGGARSPATPPADPRRPAERSGRGKDERPRDGRPGRHGAVGDRTDGGRASTHRPHDPRPGNDRSPGGQADNRRPRRGGERPPAGGAAEPPDDRDRRPDRSRTPRPANEGAQRGGPDRSGSRDRAPDPSPARDRAGDRRPDPARAEGPRPQHRRAPEPRAGGARADDARAQGRRPDTPRDGGDRRQAGPIRPNAAGADPARNDDRPRDDQTPPADDNRPRRSSRRRSSSRRR